MDDLMKCIAVSLGPPFQKQQKALVLSADRNVLEQNICENCTHTADLERVLTGTWVIDEVRLAVEYGYKILEIY